MDPARGISQPAGVGALGIYPAVCSGTGVGHDPVHARPMDLLGRLVSGFTVD